MAPVLVAGMIIVNLALIFYTAGIVTEQRLRRVSPRVLTLLSAGVVFDITATVCMIIGSPNTPFSLHGFLGYSSLTGMIIETVLAWRHRNNHGDARVSQGLHLYSRLAYLWWLLAYVTGALIIVLRR